MTIVYPLGCRGSYFTLIVGLEHCARPLVLGSSKEASNDHGLSIRLLRFSLWTGCGPPHRGGTLVLGLSKEGCDDHGLPIGLVRFLLCTIRGPPLCAWPLVLGAGSERRAATVTVRPSSCTGPYCALIMVHGDVHALWCSSRAKKVRSIHGLSMGRLGSEKEENAEHGGSSLFSQLLAVCLQASEASAIGL